MTNRQQKFKENNPDYFKQYYQRNKTKFHQRNKNRISNRKYYYVIELDGTKYCFNCKKDVKIQKIPIHDLQDDSIVIYT